MPYKSEFDATPIIETIWQANKHCYLPVLSMKDEEKSLSFVRYRYGDALHVNEHSILEPINAAHSIAAEKLDLVIVPLLAFDSQGHRLGAGGGYYDRTFKFLHDCSDKKPLLIGLAYAAQQTDELPADPWDIRLAGVITEKNSFIFNVY